MPDWQSLLVFASATLVLVAIPGPNTLYIIARSVEQGSRAGVVSGLGVQVGTMLHLLAAAFGVSALVVASASSLLVVRIAGAAYLIGLGIKTLATRGDAAQVHAVGRASLGRIFLQGTLVNLLNPKTILFLLAFLPQFLDPARGSVARQTLALGAVMCTLGMTSDMVYALAAGRIGLALRASPAFARRQRVLSGCVYIGLGATTALTGPGKR